MVDLQKKKKFFFSILYDSWISVRYVLINMEYKWQNTKTVFSFDHKIYFFLFQSSVCSIGNQNYDYAWLPKQVTNLIS